MDGSRSIPANRSSVSFLLAFIAVAIAAFIIFIPSFSDDSDAAVTDFDEGDFHYTVLATADDEVQISYRNDVQDIVFPATVTHQSVEYKVKQVAAAGFMEKDCIRSLTFSEGMDIIDTYAFYGCTNLKTVTLPLSLTKILDFSFSNCPVLETIIIDKYVSVIETQAFFNCASLREITVNVENLFYTDDNGVLFDKSKEKLITYPLGKTGDTFSMPNTVVTIEKYSMYYAKFKTVVMSNTLISINESAFEGSSIRAITIPSKVSSIGSRAFVDCKSLETVTVVKENKNYSSLDGVLFNVSKTELILFPSSMAMENYTVPETVFTISDYSFMNSKYLQEIEFTSDISSIGKYAFSNCIKLLRIDIPDSVSQIGQGAFSGCSSIKSILLPSKATVLEDSVFRDCTSLEVFYITTNITTIRADAFTGCTSIRYLFIPSTIEYCTPSTSFGGFTFYDRNEISVISTIEAIRGHTYRGSIGSMVQQIGTYSMIHYDENGGNVILDDEMIKHSTTYMFPKYTGSIDGYTFSGWLYGSNVYKPGDTMTSPRTNAVITAVWEKEVIEDKGKTIQPDFVVGLVIAVIALAIAAVIGHFVAMEIKKRRILMDEGNYLQKNRRRRY